MFTKKQALQILANIEQSSGYKETDGPAWLGPRLHELRLFIDGLPLGAVSTPEPVQPKPPEDACCDGVTFHSSNCYRVRD